MESRSRSWLAFRIATVLLSLPAWIVIRSQMQDDFSDPPSWYFPLLLTGFVAFGVVALCALRSDKEWAAPSWRNNPFDIARPLEGFHLSAWSFLGGALALFLSGLMREPIDWAWVLPGCMGVGILLGVHIASIPEDRHGT